MKNGLTFFSVLLFVTSAAAEIQSIDITIFGMD